MQITITSNASGIGNLPAYFPDSYLKGVYALAGRSIIIDVQPAYVLGGLATDPTSAFKLMNVADESVFVPAASKHPTLVPVGHGNGYALRFGFGNDLSYGAGNPNGMLMQEDDAPLWTGGSYTIGMLARVPVVGGGETGGPSGGAVIGNRVDTGYAVARFDYSSGALAWYHNAQANALLGGPYDTAAWHNFVLSYDAGAAQVGVYVDGAGSGIASSLPVTAGSALQQRRVLIGGTGQTSPNLNNWFIGDISALVLIQERAYHQSGHAAELATLQAFLDNRKAALA